MQVAQWVEKQQQQSQEGSDEKQNKDGKESQKEDDNGDLSINVGSIDPYTFTDIDGIASLNLNPNVVIKRILNGQLNYKYVRKKSYLLHKVFYTKDFPPEGDDFFYDFFVLIFKTK